MASPSAAAAIDWLFGRLNFETFGKGSYGLGDLKLERMRRLLAALGDPQLQTPCVHVAGSKGKGSVVYAVDAIVRAGGYRVGRFTSPHIERFHERIAIDGEPIDDAALAAAFEVVRPVVEQLDRDDLAATFFEIGTALAWVSFLQAHCDLAIMEVGLGGRLDSTNLCRPIVTSIVSISRDHGHILGHGLDQIAREKAGILKAGVPAVIGRLPREANREVAAIAADVGTETWTLGSEVRRTTVDSSDRGGTVLSVASPSGVTTVSQRMPGDHQSDNLAVAVAVAHRLRQTQPSFTLSDAVIADGAATISVPLRIEIVRDKPRIVLDVAHNAASVQALLDATAPGNASRRIAIFGTSNDKHVDEMLAVMRQRFDLVILTEYSINPRALPIEELDRLAGDTLDCRRMVCRTPAEALEAAIEEASDPGDEILAFGSFFLASELRQLLLTMKGTA